MLVEFKRDAGYRFTASFGEIGEGVRDEVGELEGLRTHHDVGRAGGGSTLTAEAGLTEIRSDTQTLESQKTFFIGHYMKISTKR